jgi:acyl-coenzyme A thioesterase 13
MTNRLGNLHGGCSATLVDILTSTILVGVGKPGVFGYGGVSRGLRLTYLRPVPAGTNIRLICEVVQIGKRMALTRAEISRADDGIVCVVGEHEKANTDPDIMKI